MDNSQATATSSQVSSSNFSHSPDAQQSPDASERQLMSFKGPSPPDASQRSARIPQFVPKQRNAQQIDAQQLGMQLQNLQLQKEGKMAFQNRDTTFVSSTHIAHFHNLTDRQHPGITRLDNTPNTQQPQYVQRQNRVQNAWNPTSMDQNTVVPQSHGQWMNRILAQNGAKNSEDRRQATIANGTSSMRSMWERRIDVETELKEQEDLANATLHARRQFLFPKWRSVDPLTASLVASHKTPEMIPRDSRIPDYRQEKLVETERAAPYDKLDLHKPYIEKAVTRQLQKAARRMFVRPRPQNPEELARARATELLCAQKKPWYDPAEIRDQISCESIANVGATRQMFERGDPWDHGTFREDQKQQLRQRSQSGGAAYNGAYQGANYICRSVHKF